MWLRNWVSNSVSALSLYKINCPGIHYNQKTYEINKNILIYLSIWFIMCTFADKL